MKKRKAGVLLNISSLPGPFGIGVLGKEAESFIDKTAAMGFTYWQILPIGTLDSGNSPYAGESAFAGNYLYIDPRKLAAKGLVNDADVREGVYYGSPYTVDYEFAFAAREKLLRKAYLNYKTISGETKDLSADSAVEAVKLKKEITEFTEKNKWVVKYARFKAIKNKNGGMPWRKWNNSGKSETDKDILNGISEETEYVIFVQYLFYKQWREIKDYANGKNIRIIGDMPLYVSMDSCDVWSEPWLFQLDKDTMEPKQVAGVPPDYFSEDGQLWGNPLYDWNAMKKENYRWWRDRISFALEIYDVLRIDHFRGLASYWAIPANARSGKEGHWEKGPGQALFDAVKERYGAEDIIAEDLGVFGEDVVGLLESTGFAGMRVVQFGFDSSHKSTHLPHNYPKNCVAYVGTHDNNTLLGWLWEASTEEREFALRYCGFDGEDWGEGGYKSKSCRSIIEAVWRSAADTVIISLQDMCGFGNDARMNIPGVDKMNWRYRADENTINSIDAAYFCEINDIFDRK